MKLEKILDHLNSFEKNSFLKILDNIIANNPKNSSAIEKILSEQSKELKDIDNLNVAKVFDLVQDEFEVQVNNEFNNTASQLDILTDIIVRDGNCLMRHEWFDRLYVNELKTLNSKIKEFTKSYESESSDIDEQRRRDYNIYKACLTTAYKNDLETNHDAKITSDEQSILYTLSQQLELSKEEIKLINYSILKAKPNEIDSVINDLKNIGVIFYSKKNNMIYVADEVVKVLRKVRGKETADKYFRRVLKQLREPQINLICRKHNIDWRSPYDQKIKEIIKEGISFTTVLARDIYKDGTKVTEKKKVINDLIDKKLNLNTSIKGVTLEEKISNLIQLFDDIEKDEKVGITVEGFEQLLIDIGENIGKTNQIVKSEFELQDENVLSSDYLLDYNIKPRDILEIIPLDELEKFCLKKEIKTRGDLISNILESYKDSENLFLENYENVGFRNLEELKNNGIKIKESELGIKFEDITKLIFNKLGFNVDESLRRKLNTKKDKIDIVLSLGNSDLIIVECKTVKESGYNKFSSVSRQLKAYYDLAKVNDFQVIKSLLVAPEFSDDFINDCELEYELNLSLITASSLKKILDGFKSTKHKQFPYKLLMRDVLIQEDRILKAISK